MANATSKLQLLIELRNKLNAGLTRARRQVDEAVGGMQRRLNSLGAGNLRMFNAISEQVPGIGSALGMLANPYAAAAAAAVAAGAAIVKCTQAANEWHEKMAEINVTAEKTPEELKKLSDQLLNIGARNVAPLEEVPKTFGRIISAGLSVEQSLATLEPTLRAAKAAFTDTETVASAAVSVMMSSGLEANRVYDILFATVKEGNAEFKDIAQYLPKVIPLARNVGFELEETAGAFASLTGKLSAEQSTTALQGIMRALSDQRVALGQVDKKTGKYISGFKALGIDVYDKQTKQIRPLLDIVNELSSSMAGLSDRERMLKFDKLGLDQMGTVGFSTLMQDMDGLKKAIDATTSSQGALNKAYDDAKTPMDSWRTIGNLVKAAMIKIGEVFLPIVEAIGQKILETVNYFKELYNRSAILQGIVSVLGAQIKIIFTVAMIPIKGLWNMLKLIGEAFVWIQGKMQEWGVIDFFKRAHNAIRPILIYIKELVGQIGGILYDLVTFDVKGAYDKFKNFQMPQMEEIRARIKAEEEPGDTGVDGPHPYVPEQTKKPDKPAATDALDDARKISGGSQTKNITVNIGSFIEGFTPSSQTINGMNTTELERWMTEMFMRVVRSAEMAV